MPKPLPINAWVKELTHAEASPPARAPVAVVDTAMPSDEPARLDLSARELSGVLPALETGSNAEETHSEALDADTTEEADDKVPAPSSGAVCGPGVTSVSVLTGGRPSFKPAAATPEWATAEAAAGICSASIPGVEATALWFT